MDDPRPEGAHVEAADFLIATRVRHETDQRVRRVGSLPQQPQEDDEEAEEVVDLDSRLRAAASLLATRSQHEANVRVVHVRGSTRTDRPGATNRRGA